MDKDWNRLSGEVVEPCLWGYYKPEWTQSWVPGSRWPCLRRVAGLDDLQRTLPTSTLL